jgi:glycosyltransferase involved in cell wall biosynthesis
MPVSGGRVRVIGPLPQVSPSFKFDERKDRKYNAYGPFFMQGAPSLLNKCGVCFIAPKAYPLFNPTVNEPFGGAPVDLYFLATELARDSAFAVSFIVADYGQAEEEIRAGVRLIKSFAFRDGPVRSTRRVWEALKRADADIYFHKSITAGTALIAWFCRRHGRKFIYRTASSRECDGTDVRARPLLGLTFKWALHHANAVSTQTESDAQSLRATLGVDSVVIRNGWRIPPLVIQPRDTILWAGRTMNVKRPERFVELARQMPDLHFTMICQHATGDDRYEQFVAEARQVQNLTFLEHVPFSEIGAYFQRARVLVNTSDSEGFPNTFIQACIAATPILSLNVNPDGFLDRFDCGRCAGGDGERFTQILRELCEPGLAARLGDHGRRYAEQYHNVGKVIEEYKTVFRKLQSQQPRGHGT